MRVVFYGKLASIAGRELELAAATPCSVAALRAQIVESHPEMEQSLGDRRVRACIDGTLVPDNHSITQGDTIEFLAPVSGG